MFLSVKAIPTARVPLEERYSVHKIRAIDGEKGPFDPKGIGWRIETRFLWGFLLYWIPRSL